MIGHGRGARRAPLYRPRSAFEANSCPATTQMAMATAVAVPARVGLGQITWRSGCWIQAGEQGRWLAQPKLSESRNENGVRLRSYGATAGQPSRWIVSEGWWRRRESNPRPKARPRGTLHACPLLKSHTWREEAAKNRQIPDAVNLTGGPRASNHQPACFMASGPQPPGEARANVTAYLIKQRERTDCPQLTDVPSD